MASFFKFIPFIAVIGVIVFIVALYSVRHYDNVTTTQEIEVGTDSIQLGEARISDNNVFDKDALVSNLIVDIVKNQKGHGKDIKVSYVFLDKNGNVTNDDDEIVSVQFKVDLIEDGKVLSSSYEKRTLRKDENNI